MKFGSLFSGIGGLDLGLERAGMECRWQCEINSACQKTLRRHWGDVIFDDVREVRKGTVETVDLICGGFPCQPVSVAGKRKAQSDSRWMWPEFARVVDELRPTFVLLENVPGLLSAGCSEVTIDLAEMGYDAEWGCLSASSFGAPYRRSRWFCVADNDGHRFKWGTKQDVQSFLDEFQSSRWSNFERCCEDGSYPCGTRQQTRSGESEYTGIPVIKSKRRCRIKHSCDAHSERLAKRESKHEEPHKKFSPFVGTGWWDVEPNVVRVVPGFPGRVDRIKGLGNSVVPIVAHYLGTRIIKAFSQKETLNV